MKIITRYILFALIKPLIYSTIGLYFLMIIADLFGNADDFINTESSIFLIFKLYLVQFPRLAQLILPVSFLVSSLYVLANLSHHRETIAIQGAGISLARMAFPFFAVASLLGILLFCFFMDLAPSSESKRRVIENVIKGKESEDLVYHAVVYNNPESNTLWFLQTVNITTQTFTQGEILLRDAAGNDIKKLFVAQGTYRDEGFWDLAYVREINYDKNVERTSSDIIPQLNAEFLKDPPEKLVAVLRPPDQLSWPELHHFIYGPKEHANIRMAPYYTEHYYRLAYPLIPFVLALYAIALGVTHSRQNVGAVIMNCVFILLTLLIWQKVSLSLGKGYRIPPLVAGFSGVVFFGIIGLSLYAYRVGWLWNVSTFFTRPKSPKLANPS
ncbi:MAG: LptF/LptG family permease [Verrucomicrobiota bacterium]